MKLYLASFFEPDNYGPGRKISVATGVPKDIKVNSSFDPLVPEGMREYYRERNNDMKAAGEKFEISYNAQLDKLYKNLVEDAKNENKEIKELLPFQDGDTLLSWEKSGNTSYRLLLNDFLKKLGYEVALN